MPRFVVGTGQSIFIWHDPLHSRGSLLKFYGPIILNGFGSSMHAKLCAKIHDGQWSWPAVRSRSHLDLQSFLFSLVPTRGADIVT